jgi:hypothetical protein
MKCPANCPGELGKEEKKKIKVERQEAAKAAAFTANGTVTSDSASDVPRLSRSDTMNTLSSGFSASAQRSVSGTTLTPTSVSEEEPPKKSQSMGERRNRLVAPPPTNYVTSDPDSLANSNGDNSKSSESKGRMLYSYQQHSDGEITVQDGQEVLIVEPDGTLILSILFRTLR